MARIDHAAFEAEEHDYGVGVGLFFRDPDGRPIEAITYRGPESWRKGSQAPGVA